jgi:hypothetical protein
LAVAVAIVAAGVFAAAPLTKQADEAWIGGSIGVYFDVAVNWIYCGRYGKVVQVADTTGGTLNFAQIRDLTLYDKSVPELMTERMGSVEAYCAAPATNPNDLYEPSMMLMEAATLAVWPSASLRDVAWFGAVIRVVIIGLFAWALLVRGFSLIFVLLSAGSAIYIVALLGGNALYANYPYILPLTLLAMAIADCARVPQRLYAQAAWYALLGLAVALLGSMRTSHYPEALTVALLALAAGYCFTTGSRWKRLARVAVCAVMFAAGLMAFQRVFITPLKHDNFVRHYHMIAHPIVLGLANPPNALAAREGIEWTDHAGVLLAKRIDPTVGDDTMGERYEQAMWAYFTKLWIYYPAEMRDIYYNKFVATTEAAYAFLENPKGDLFWLRKNAFWMPIFAWLGKPITTWLTAGGMALLLIGAGWLMARRQNQRGFTIAAIGGVAWWSFLETAVTLPQIVLWYSPVYVFTVVCFGLVVLELVLGVIERRYGRPVPSHDSAGVR